MKKSENNVFIKQSLLRIAMAICIQFKLRMSYHIIHTQFGKNLLSKITQKFN